MMKSKMPNKIKLEKALENYEKGLRQGVVHAYITNSCYDSCAHCYMSSVPVNSRDTRNIDADDLIHFINLIRSDSKKPYLAFSGGDPLAHPKITKLLSHFNNRANLEIMTSGLALSSKNTTNRKELLEALAKSDAYCVVASPNEPYHSITWEDIKDIKKYIKEQGFNPSKFGYASKTKDNIHKALVWLFPPTLMVSCIGKLIDKISGGSKMPEVIAIGRAKNLPKEQHIRGNRDCDLEDTFSPVYINYDGKLQYCLYTCHDGFMNINELRNINNKDEAIKHIIYRLSEDISFRDIIDKERCYFTDEIRKKWVMGV